MHQKPVILCILDGWGISPRIKDNAIALAKTPHYDALLAQYPNATLITYGPDVGLPEGQMGNSEVGHMNIGAGRVVEMDLRRIESAIESGRFPTLPALERFCAHLHKTGGAAHLCGVLSDGGVHAHLDHLLETARVLDQAGLEIVLHLFTDGRDVAPRSALGYLETLFAGLPEKARIGTISGRYYAMDRDNRWERIQLAYAAIMSGSGPKFEAAEDLIQTSYAADISDEFIKPAAHRDYAGMRDGDGLLFVNFRADRARQILAAIGDPEFDAFEIAGRAELAALTGFAQYSDRHDTYMEAVFPDTALENTLGQWVAKQGKRQFRIAETEKYPHVTFFFNGGEETPNPSEDRYLAPSPKVATYDLCPEMSSQEVTENLVEAIHADYDLIIVNYANPDMVGHTGDLQAAIRACEAVDTGLGQVVAALRKVDGAMILCADHGNCEVMLDPETGAPHTAHTTNPVPVALINGPKDARLRDGGRLADLAPSLLALMGLDQPAEMTGKSLIE